MKLYDGTIYFGALGDASLNLTNIGRVRMEIDAKIVWEIINNLFLNLSFYDSFDNEPPSGAAKNDWGLVFSFGYTF